MKATLLYLTVFSFVAELFAQSSYVHFGNSQASLVLNAATGQGLVPSNGVVVSLYGAPDGTTDESLFVKLVATNAVFYSSVLKGRYQGGYPYAPSFPCESFAMIQLRAFEQAYGSTYEAAIAAPPMNGRRALAGKSAIARVQLSCYVIAEVGDAVGGFTVSNVPGPVLFNVNDIVVAEGSNGVATANFTVQLVGATNETRSVSYATTNGTALAGSDYVATSGTLTFAPGETSKTASITITPDVPPEDDEDFYLVLSNPVNGEIGRASGKCIITELRVLGLRVDTVVTFNTVNGHHYAVEKSNDMVNWTSVLGATNVLGTGSAVTAVDQGSGCSAMMAYRVRLID